MIYTEFPSRTLVLIRADLTYREKIVSETEVSVRIDTIAFRTWYAQNFEAYGIPNQYDPFAEFALSFPQHRQPVLKPPLIFWDAILNLI